MSAYLCSEQHTYTLALFHARQLVTTGAGVPTSEVIETAQRLRALNNYALQCRYGDKPESLRADPFPALAAATAWLEGASAADIFGAVRGFAYQCSEGDADKRPEWALLTDIRTVAEFDAGANTETAVWSIDDGDPAPASVAADAAIAEAKNPAPLTVAELVAAFDEEGSD